MPEQPKSIAQSKTMWGLALTAPEVLIQLLDVLLANEESLRALLPAPWITPILAAAGILLAFVGRLVAKKPIKGVVLPPAALALTVVMIGCQSAGRQARESLVSPRTVAAWPDIAGWANRGIADMEDDGEIGPGAGESHRERVRQFGESIDRLGEPR